VSGPVSVFCHVVGAASTTLIFAVLAWNNGSSPEVPKVVLDEVYAVVESEAPPPPMEEVAEPPSVAVNDLLLLAEERTASAVKLPAAPIVPEFVPESAGPPQFEFSMTATKPSLGQQDGIARRIFERSEVDEPPRPLLKKRPRLPDAMTKVLPAKVVRFLFVVNVDGSVEQARVLSSTGNAAVDSICLEALKGWKFTPAVRQGQKVRCWVEQGFSIRPPTRSPFEA
jgi:TonB family protein